MYFPRLATDGSLNSLTMKPLQMQRFQLRNAPDEAVGWLKDILDRECEQFGHEVKQKGDLLVLDW